MHASQTERRSGSPAALGLILVAVGIAALALRQSGLDVAEIVERAGWPFFVIIPGLVLLAAAVAAPVPGGLGFAIAGSIVTTVGSILLYQESTNHWESWAYAWALIPAASGLAMTVYGLATGRRVLVTGGLRTASVAGVLFLAGFWYFEAVFETGRAPIELGQWWPLIVIALGLLIAGNAVVRSPTTPEALPTDDTPPLRGDRP